MAVGRPGPLAAPCWRPAARWSAAPRMGVDPRPPTPATRRIKYYNNCLFHDVQRNFLAQTGDPTGTGKGGESING